MRRTRPSDDDVPGVYDVVSGWKRVRHDPWHKVGPSRVFNGMVSWFTGVTLHDHNCGMKCYRAEVFQEVRLYGELHRFIPVLAAARGFRIGEIEINHRPRRFGQFQVRRPPLRQRLSRPADGQVPDRLRPAAAAPARQLGLFSFLLGNAGYVYLGVTWLINASGWPEARPRRCTNDRC